MGTKRRPPPPELLKACPGLGHDPDIVNPSQGPAIGDPPRKYTIALHERICEELRKGQRPQGACARAGITLSTFYEWMRLGKAGNVHLYQFAEDVEVAFNTAEADAVDVITDSFRNTEPEHRNPEDVKWYLERTRADGYSKKVKTEVEGQIQDFLLRLETALEPALFERVLAVYLGQAPATVMGTRQLPEHASSQESPEELK